MKFFHHYRSIVVLLGLLVGAFTGPQPQPAPVSTLNEAPSTIFHNGVIITMNAEQPIVEAIAVRGEKIAALGSSQEILALQDSQTTVIDLGGRTLMPGFVDAHTHILNDARSQGLSLDQAQALALRNGITTLGDLYIDEPFLREIQAFADRGELRVRTNLYLVANTNCGVARGRWYEKYAPTREPGEMLRIAGVKIFTDGGSCGGVALSFELEPGHGHGDLWLAQEELDEWVAALQAAGYQVAIHAIGDRAVEQAQQSLALALDGAPNTYRHRVEHISVLRPELIPRFGELGILPVLSGEYPSCTPFGPPLPEEYQEWEWPWRSLRSANPGLPIAWHSDYPFQTTNPFVHLYGFVTRSDVFQTYTCPGGDWLLDDTLTVQDALSIMTIESAYTLFRDAEVGSLEPGKYADMIVVSDNPLAAPEQDLKSLKVLATMVGGRFEYCNPRNSELCPGYVQRQPAPLPDYRPAVPVRWLILALAAVLPLGAVIWNRRPVSRIAPLRSIGAAAILGGILWAWAWIAQSRVGDTFDWVIWPLVTAGTLLAVAGAGLAASHLARRGIWGMSLAALAMVAFSVSIILIFWQNIDEIWMLMFLTLLVHAVGLIIFGLANLRSGSQPPLARLALASGLFGVILPFILSFVIGEGNWIGTVMGAALGLGWIAIGLTAALSQRERNPAPTPNS